jgi:DNA-binding transcriptional LysR family regulator
MPRPLPPISTDQVLAFVELARAGSLRGAAADLNLSEEGLRGRLVTLEQRVGASLYRRSRGRRGGVDLTAAGQLFLPKARKFLEQAHTLANSFAPAEPTREIAVAASHYLTFYLLIDVVRAYRDYFPDISIRLHTRTERQIVSGVGADADMMLGICAPQEYPKGLAFQPWFTMGWFFVAASGHPLLRRASIELEQLVAEPLIMFEPGSTGRQHVLEAFYRRELTPRVAMEATTTQIIVRMVEAGLGVAILPLLPSGAVTRGMNIGSVPLGEQIRPIESGVLYRPEFAEDPAIRGFVDFVLATQP